MKELEKFYEEYKDVQRHYQLALSTMYYDIATIAPKKGVPARNQAMTFLSGEAFTKATDPQSLQKIEQLGEQTQDMLLKKEIQLLLKELESNRALPKDVYMAFQQAIHDSEASWEQAKLEQNYSLFEPHLQDLIQKQKEGLTYMNKQASDYDTLLDRYQEGMNTKAYDAFFASIKQHLVPLIQEIAKRQSAFCDDALKKSFDIPTQKAYHSQLLNYFQMDKGCCILGETQHPFTEFFSAHEARITTHFYEHDVIDPILSTIHEYGHAQYDLQVRSEFDGTALKNGIGFAMHESQSRLMENHIGRNRALWEVQLPVLQTYFPQLKGITLDDFMNMINISKPSLIRTAADELTYPLHILIRYEMEKEIFDGNGSLEQLNERWKDKYEQYLGIRPNHDAEGILQDMHWGAANFGYFPTYALGSAYAAQMYHSMTSQLDVDTALRNNQFYLIRDWLKENIHQYGASLTADEILRRATGEAFNPAYYIEYLTTKYKTLYQL